MKDIMDFAGLHNLISHRYPLLFATLSGAHLYGFPSPDSDYDVRGAHILGIDDVIGLTTGPETITSMEKHDGREIDLVTHDIAKFFRLLLKPNGYVLEQLYSPLVVHGNPGFAELKSIAKGCITRHHGHHYLGFAKTQCGLLDKEEQPRLKPVLYIYRVLFTGIHLMNTGEVEANLIELNKLFKLNFIEELIACKLAGEEKAVIYNADIEFHRNEYHRLTGALEEAMCKSHLPDAPSAQGALNDLLIRVRKFSISEAK